MEFLKPKSKTESAVLGHALPALGQAERDADRIIGVLQEAGFEAYRVGGCVRDRLLGRPVKDVDVATSAPPAKVTELFEQTYAVGAAFGVVVVKTRDGTDTEVATFREETNYVDGRHPKDVRFSDAPTDALRRDFTINALYYDPVRRTVIDYVNGLDDLSRGILRAIGAPAQRFSEDYLRMLRVVRFSAELGFDIEKKTEQAVQELSRKLAGISAERVYVEMTRMLTGRNPSMAFRRLFDLGLLDQWLPEVKAMSGVKQPPQFHPEGDVWEHTLVLLSLLRGRSEVLAWAALLHDVGKPPTQTWRKGRESFPEHAEVGAEMSRDILKRLKVSNKMMEQVYAIVRNHMTFKDVPDMRRSTLRRLIARETFSEELELHRLDCAASHGGTDNYVYLLDRMSEFRNEPVMPAPLLSGHDVLRCGLTPGPVVGKILREAQELQLEEKLRNREDALRWLHNRLEGIE